MWFTDFCDYYVDHVYPFISDNLGKVMDSVTFPIGEVLMYIGAIWLIITLLSLLLWPFLRRREGYAKGARRNLKRVGIVTVVMVVIYVFNWVIPFHASYITFPLMEGKGFTYLEIEEVRNWVVEGLNEAALAAERDEEGHLVVPETVDEDVVLAMQSLGDEFPRLKGYYPRLKEALCTEFLQYMRIGGYTYPYTMELTGNGYDMVRLYYPTLYAHESCHHQGYYQEDEADFLAYIGLSRSEDPYVRYSAFYQMYYLVEPKFRSAAKTGFATEEEYKEYLSSLISPDPVFYEDMNHDYEIFREEYDKHIHLPEKVQTISSKAADVGWKAQADLLQEKIYGGSFGLLLKYYYSE